MRSEIAQARARVAGLVSDLRVAYSEMSKDIVARRKAGHSLDDIAFALNVSRGVVINNLHNAGVLRPGPRLHDFSLDQRRRYRKLRHSGLSAEDARREAGMV